MSALELRVPPLLVALVAALAIGAIAWALPSLEVAIAVGRRQALAGLLLTLGIGFAAAGVVAFRKARTTVDPTRAC